MSSRSASVKFYDQNAAAHAARYSSTRFEDVHTETLAYLPAPPARVLDVGAGTGRDAAALADRGYAVMAVEPSHELQNWGRNHYAHLSIEWLDDRLPGLRSLQTMARRFDFILCSAVLIHVRPRDLRKSFASFAGLLASGGHLAISVRDRRDQDPQGIFFNHGDTEVEAAAASAQFALTSKFVSPDRLGRHELAWHSFIFTK